MPETPPVGFAGLLSKRGCGPGSITLDLAELVFPGKVIGIDIESRHIHWAKQLQQDKKVQNVKFLVADLIDLPFDDGTFDAAFAHGVVECTSGAKAHCRGEGGSPSRGLQRQDPGGDGTQQADRRRGASPLPGRR